MTAIVAGQGLGLFNTSANVLGDQGQIGTASQGRSGEKVAVNASTGNLVVQQQDEWLVGIGPDVGLLRTYNSLATSDGDNNDNWRLGLSRKISATSTAAASITRVGDDGAELTYTNVSGKFVNKDGAGSFDTITWDAANSQWVWEDGNTHTKEYYKASGAANEYRLVQITDADNNTVTVNYDATSGLISSVKTSGGEVMELTYEAATVAGKKPHIKSVQLKSTASASSAYLKRVTYDYDAQDRLKKVWVDLIPTDGSIADGKVYWTEYTYIDTASNRLKTLKQSDDSQLEFHYDASNRIDWIKETITPGTTPEVRQTSFNYGTANTTQITDASGQVTELTYVNTAGASYGQIQALKRPLSGASTPALGFTYDADGNVQTTTDARGNQTKYRYDTSGNCFYQEDAQGNVTERTYGTANQVLTETVYSGRDTDLDGGASGALTTRYIYDTTYPTRLRYVVSPEGRVTRNLYNALGQLSSTIQFPNDTYASYNQDFGINASGLTTAAAFVRASNQLQYTASTTASTATISTTATATLGSLWSADVTTPASIGQDLLFLGLESGTAGAASFRRLRLRVSNGQFYTESQSGTSANAAVALGTAKTSATYVVEFDTRADGSMTLYVYEKGKERSTGFSKVFGSDAGWTAPKLYIQGNSGAGAIAGTIGIDNLVAQLRPTLTDLDNWVNALSDRTSWSRTDYVYDPLRGQLQSQLTFGRTTAAGDGAYSDWNEESWSDNEVQYIYNQSGNLLQKIESTKAGGVLNSDNSWALDQRRQLGIVYAAATANGAQGDPKKVVDLTTADKALIQSKATFNTVFLYDGLNRITKQTDAAGNVTVSSYDDAARTTKVVLANGLTSTSTYDRAGGLIAKSQFDAATPAVSLGATEYTYDTMGRLSSTKVVVTGERSYVLYDALGRKVGDVDAEGVLTEYRYNDQGQLTRTIAYANKLSSAMLALLAADPSAGSVPANLLNSGLVGWGAVASNAAKITVGVNTPTATTSAAAQLAGDTSQWLKQIDADTTLTSQLQSGLVTLPTVGSRRFDVSAYVGVVNATASIEVQFFDVVPSSTTVPLAALVPGGTGAVTSTNTKTGGTSLSDYARLVGYVDAPAAAKYARVVIKKTATAAGKTESYLYVTHPLLAQAATSTTVAKPFAALDLRGATSYVDHTILNVYDKAGRLAKTITSRGDGSNALDEVGAVVEYRYDGAGRLTDTIAYATAISQQAGLSMSKLRGAVGELQAVDGKLIIDGTSYSLMPDALNDRRTRNFYSADGLLIGQLDAENYYTQNTYNGQGLLTASTRYGKSMAPVVPEGNTPPVPVGNTWDLLTGQDRTTRYYYNGRKQLIGTIDGENYYTAYQYDAGGNKLRQTRYATPVVNLDAKVAPAVRSTVPANGAYVLIATEDQSTTYFYDANNRLVRTQELPTNVVNAFEYDKVGNLTRSVVALGTTDERAASKRYDAAGRVIAELGGVGSSMLAGLTDQVAIDNIWKTYGVQHVYDAAGRRIATYEPDGSTATGIRTVFYYDKAGRLTHSINALGEIIQYSYNAFGEQTEVRKMAARLLPGTVLTLGGGLNTALGTSVSSLRNNSLDSSVSKAYTRDGSLLTVTDGEGKVSDYGYDTFGGLMWSEAPLVNNEWFWTEYAYDRRGLLKEARDVANNSGVYRHTLTQYNAFGQIMSRTDAQGKQVLQAYDRLGRSFIVTNVGTVNFGITTVYDAFNRIVTQTDQYSRDTTYQYDSANRSFTVTTPEGASAGFKTTTVLNREGQTVSVTDGRGAYTQYSYDADGRLTGTVVKNLSTDSTAQTSESTTYDNAGKVKTTTNAQGGVSTFTYDKANRVLVQEQTDGLGGTLRSEYRYDALGRAVWKKDASGTWTQTEFDRNGRVKAIVVDPKSIPSSSQAVDTLILTLVTNPDVGGGLALRTEFEYDDQGHTRFVTEGVGSTLPKKTEYQYDVQGRRQFEIVDPNGLKLTTQYVYDVNNNVVARIDAENQTTRYVYDEANRVSFEVDGRGAVKQTEYDGAGNITRVTAYAKLIDLSAVGVQATTATEVTSRLGAANASVDHVTRYVYDGNNRLTFTIDSQGYGTRNEYDQVGNVVVSTRYAAKIPVSADTPIEGKVRFSVDLVALKALADDSKDQVDQYVYDGARRVIGHVDALGGYTKTVYRADNREIRTIRYANAVVYPTTPTAPTAKNRLVLNTLPKTSTTDPNPSVITEPTVRPNSGVITGKDVVAYTWLDALGRVTGTQDGEGYEITYRRDGMGHVLQVTNESKDSLRNVYDRAGRQTLAVDAGGTMTETKYDEAGRVKQTSQRDGAIGVDMGVSVGIGGKLARDLGSFNSGDVVTVTGWIRGDDKSYATITLGNQAGTLQSSVDSYGTRDVDDGWLQFTLTYTPTSTMNVWLTLGGDTSVWNQGKDSNIIYDDLYATVQRNGTTAITTLLDDSFFAGNVNAALLGYTATGNVTRQQYIYYGTMSNSLLAGLAAQTVAQRITAYSYDTAGRLIEETRAQGTTEQSTTRYELDKLGQRKKVIDPRGIAAATDTTDWAIDQRASILKRDRSLCLTAPVKDSADYKAILAAYTTEQTFDAQGHVKQSKDPLGFTTETTYDAFGNAIKIKDPNGNDGYFVFNELNQAIWQIDPMNYATETHYNSLGQVDKITKYAKPVKNWAPDTNGIVAPLNPDGVTQYKAAHSNALPTAPYIEADALDATTSIDHDKLGHQTRIQDAEGYYESMTYDVLGNKVTYTAKSNTNSVAIQGGTHVYDYDRRGLLVKETLPVQVTKRDLQTGDPVANAQPVDVINRYVYDARGNKLSTIEADGLYEQRVTNYKYDALDRQVEKTGQAVTIYTVAGGEKQNFVPTELRAYDTRGNLIEVKATDGARTLYYYDALNRKVAEIQGAVVGTGSSQSGVLTRYQYDAKGNTIKQSVFATLIKLPITPGGTLPSDPPGSLVRESNYVFDANRNLLKVSIPNVLFGEINLQGVYQIKSDALTTTREYDHNGNLTKEVDARGNATRHYYDKAGHELVTVDAKRYITVRTVDAGGNVSAETRSATALSAGLNLDNETAASLRLLALASTSGDDRITTYYRDKLGRVKTQEVSGVDAYKLSDSGVLLADGTVSRTSYEYNGLGLVVTKTDAMNASTTYVFDKQGRQTKETKPKFVGSAGEVAPVTDIEYDGLGQVARQIQRGSVSADDRVDSYRYDKNGNQLSQTDAKGAVTTFRVDAMGRVTSTSLSRTNADGSSAGNDITEYVYDLAGRQTQQRAQSAVQSGQTTAITTLETRETQYDAYGAIVAKGTNGGAQEFWEYDAAGRLIKTNEGTGVTKAYVRDANGNATLEIDSTGADLRPLTLSQILGLSAGARTLDSATQAQLQESGTAMTVSVYDERNQLIETRQPTMTTDAAQATVTQVLNKQQSAAYAGGVIGVGKAFNGISTATAPSVPVATNFIAVGTVTATVTKDSRVYWRAENVSNMLGFGDGNPHYLRDFAVSISGLPAQLDKFRIRVFGVGNFDLPSIAFDRRTGPIRLGSPAKGMEWMDISYDWSTSSINIHMYGEASGDGSWGDFYNSGNYGFSIEQQLAENSQDYLGVFNKITPWMNGASAEGAKISQNNNYIILPTTPAGMTDSLLTLTPFAGGAAIRIDRLGQAPLHNSAGASIAGRNIFDFSAVSPGAYKFVLDWIIPGGVATITGSMNLAATLPTFTVDGFNSQAGDRVTVTTSVSGGTNLISFSRAINYAHYSSDFRNDLSDGYFEYRKKAGVGNAAGSDWQIGKRATNSTYDGIFLTQDASGNEWSAGVYEYRYAFGYSILGSLNLVEADYYGEITIGSPGVAPQITAPIESREMDTSIFFSMLPLNARNIDIRWRVKDSGKDFQQKYISKDEISKRFMLDFHRWDPLVTPSSVIEYSYKAYDSTGFISSAHGQINFVNTTSVQAIIPDLAPTMVDFDVNGIDQPALMGLKPNAEGLVSTSLMEQPPSLVAPQFGWLDNISTRSVNMLDPAGVYHQDILACKSLADGALAQNPGYIWTDAQGASHILFSESLGLKANSTYTISVWAKLISSSKPTKGNLIDVGYRNGSGAASLAFADTVLDGTWREYSLTFSNQQAIAQDNYYLNCLAGMSAGGEVALWGLKIIEQPNLIKVGNDPSVSPWLASASTIGGSTVTAPSSNQVVKKLAESAVAGPHKVSQQVTVTDIGRYSYSVDLKAGERQKALVSVFDGQVEHGISVDLATGKVSGVTGSVVTYAIVDRGNGWYGVTLVSDMPAGAITCSVTTVDGAGSTNNLGVAGAGLYLTNASFSRTAVNAVPFMASEQSGKQGRLAPSVPLGMKISYGPAGSNTTGIYPYTTTLARAGVNLKFVLDASNVIAPTTAGVMEYSYTLYADAACTIPLLDALGGPVTIKGKVNVGTAAAPDVLQWSILGLGSEDRVIKRSQTYNAFGEVSSETDGRGNVKNMRYNTMGLLVEKAEPTVTYQKDAGAAGLSTKTDHPTTYYRYDLAGRVVGVVDANGNTNTQQWVNGDAQRVATEFHVDGGTKKNVYDIFGDLRMATDEVNRVTSYTYDKRSQITKVEHAVRQANQSSKGNSSAVNIQSVDEYTYDQAGHRVSHANNFMTSTYGASAKEITAYDAMGRVKTFTSFGGMATSYDYVYLSTILGVGASAVGGYKKTTTMPDGRTSVDYTNVFGVLASHLDFGGHTFVYNYDNAGHLTSQTSAETGQNITYTYYSNGYIKTIKDVTLGTLTGYEYDKDGNRVREYYQRGSGNNLEVLQDATISYDAMNRVSTIHDGGADIRYKYDANGNRIEVLSYYHDGVDGHASTQDYWYAYDSMNRFTITKGSFDSKSNRVISGANGILITYDNAGQRKSSTSGSATEAYTYSDDGYLIDTLINGVLYAHREVDLAGRTKGYKQYDASGTLDRTTTYDADSRVLSESETTIKGTQTQRTSTTSYAYFNTKAENQTDISTTGKGQLAKTVNVTVNWDYSQSTPTSSRMTATDYRTYQWWDDAKVIVETANNVNVQVTATKSSSGYSFVVSGDGGSDPVYANGFAVHTYDVNGHLMRVDDPANQTPGIADKGRSISYVTNAEGLIMSRNEVANGNANAKTGIVTGGTALKFRRFYYLNGHLVGDVSNDGTDQTQTSYAEQMAAIEQRDRDKNNVDEYAHWRPISSANFDENYLPINSGYPSAAAYTYTVRSNAETLQAIALSVWGDSAMWYLIAEANGLKANTQLVAGQSLTIPNKVTNIHNNSGTYHVYDAGVAIGDVSPTAPFPPPPPPPGAGCGTTGMILMIVVAVVVSVVTAGAALALIAPSMTMATATLGAAMAAGAIGGAVGSIASQLVGKATGNVKDFSWSGVAMGAIGGAVGAGVTNVAGAASSMTGAALRAAVGNAITQRVGVAMGLQKKFSWTAVAASAAGGAATFGIGDMIGRSQFGDDTWSQRSDNTASGEAARAQIDADFTGTVLRGTASGLAGGWASAMARHDRPAWKSIAIDAFGSALGDAVVGAITSRDRQQTSHETDVTPEQKAVMEAGLGPRTAENAESILRGADPQAPAKFPLRELGAIPSAPSYIDIAGNAASPPGLALELPRLSNTPDENPLLSSELPDGSWPSTLPSFNIDPMLTNTPTSRVYRGMSWGEYVNNGAERSGGLAYSRGSSGAGNMYVAEQLGYTVSLDQKSPPGKYSNYVAIDVDQAELDAIKKDAYTEPGSERAYPENKKYDKSESPGYRDKFTRKVERGHPNIGIGEEKTVEFNRSIVKTTLLSSPEAGARVGETRYGPAFDITKYAPDGAIKLQTSLQLGGKALTWYSAANDALKMGAAVQTGDLYKIGDTGSSIAGGWSTAWAASKVGARWGFQLGLRTGNPYVIAGATFVGGLAAGALGYYGGSNAASNLYKTGVNLYRNITTPRKQ